MFQEAFNPFNHEVTSIDFQLHNILTSSTSSSLNFLFILANIGYAQLFISRLGRVGVFKSPGRVDFALVAILNTSGYWNGAMTTIF